MLVSNYARDVDIKHNEFRYVGDSAIVVLGTARLIDGTDGNHPRYEVVVFFKSVMYI